MSVCNLIEKEMINRAEEEKAKHLMKFFKTGKGEYGEGDRFLGIKVPESRTIVKKYKGEVGLQDVDYLINSKWHEIRLTGFLLLIEIYNKFIKERQYTAQSEVIKFYLRNIEKGNNWDLVDLVAPKILGEHILRHPDDLKIIYELSDMEGKLWYQRVAIVSTWTLIRGGIFKPTFDIALKYLDHKHDLIHKASGWMLREVGKRGGMSELKSFLDSYAGIMPRTMLRYALEKFSPEERVFYMTKTTRH